MGAAILVTIGFLFLLQENWWYLDFGRTWPILLIVIGACSYAAHNASIEGHVQPWWIGGGTIQGSDDVAPPRRRDPWEDGPDSQVKI